MKISINPETPTKILVGIFNALSQKQVKRFPKRADAIRRVNEALRTTDRKVPKEFCEWVQLEKEGASPSTPEPQVEVSEATSQEMEALEQEVSAAVEETVKVGAPKAAPKATPKNGNGKGRASQYAGKEIHRLLDKNPRREGTWGWKSWEVISHDGMLFEDFLEAGGRRKDLDWDVKRGRIEMR